MDSIEDRVCCCPCRVEAYINNAVEVVDTTPRRGNTRIGGHHGDGGIHKEYHHSVITSGEGTANLVFEGDFKAGVDGTKVHVTPYSGVDDGSHVGAEGGTAIG